MSENLTLLQINDINAYLENNQELFWKRKKAMYKELGVGNVWIDDLIKDIKIEKNNQVLVLNNGGTIHGTFAAVDFKEKTMESGFNYPILAINAYDKKSNELLFDPYLIKDCDGLKVGIIGIAATIIDSVMPHWFSERTYFTMGKKELPHYINKLRNEKKVDLIVVLSQLGFSQETKLAEEIDGIDVLLSGHTHNRVHKPSLFNDTIIIQSDCQGSFVGRLDLEIDNRKVVDFMHQLLTVEKSITEGEEIKIEKEKNIKPHYDKLNEVLNYRDIDLKPNLVKSLKQK